MASKESKEYYENVIKQGELKKETFYREILEITNRIDTLTKWIDYANEDIEDAQEHLNNGDYEN